MAQQRPRAQPRARRSGDLFDTGLTAQTTGLNAILEQDDTIRRCLDAMTRNSPEEYGYANACANIVDRIYDPSAPHNRIRQSVEHNLIRGGAKNEWISEAVHHTAEALHLRYRQYLCQTISDPATCLSAIDCLVGLAKNKFGVTPEVPIVFPDRALDGSTYRSSVAADHRDSSPHQSKRPLSEPDHDPGKRQRTRAPTETSDYDINYDYERLPPTASEAPDDRFGGSTQGLAIRGTASRNSAAPSRGDPRESLGAESNTDWADSMVDDPPQPSNGWSHDNRREDSYAKSDQYSRAESTGRPQWDDRPLTPERGDMRASEASDRMMIDPNTPGRASSRSMPPPPAPAQPAAQPAAQPTAPPNGGMTPQEVLDDWNSHNVSGYGLWVDDTTKDPADEGFYEPKDCEIITSFDSVTRDRGRGGRDFSRDRGYGSRGGRADFKGGRGDFRGGRGGGGYRGGRDGGDFRDDYRSGRGRGDYRDHDRGRGGRSGGDFRGGRGGDSYAGRDDYGRRDRSPPRDFNGGGGRGGRGGGGRPCRFFNSARGCHAANCSFAHVSDNNGPRY